MMAIARRCDRAAAEALVVFIWHSGEEAGPLRLALQRRLPVVPESIQAQLNMDMVGRDDCDNLEADYTNSVFVVGADRISTDLHNLIVKTNAGMQKPLTLDYELNDPMIRRMSTPGAITTAMRRRAFRSCSSRRVFTRTTTA